MRIPTSKQDKGFTLIELLVVVVIIGILAAVAIPVFLNQREKAVDSGIKSDLKALATTQETYYVDARAYTTSATALGDAGFNATKGNKIEAALVGTTTKAYCLRGSNPGGSKGATGYFYYASDDGGLSETATGACATASGWQDVSNS